MRTRLSDHGIDHLWGHQREAAEAAYLGRSVALATGTGSGKSLAYQLPILAVLEGSIGHEVPRRALQTAGAHSAIYLAPTKALAHDQWRSIRSLAAPTARISALDGDSDQAERRFARDHARFILSNPDMLHRSVLPHHSRWVRLLASLRYVVIDEAHRYRGVFGAQVSQVLRRLRRLAAHYGADPVFISCSATSAHAGEHLELLTGLDRVQLVDTDHSRRPTLDLCLWQSEEDPHREAAELTARLVNQGSQVLTFTSSRVQAELVALRAGELAPQSPIASYRAGYLAADRRRLEAGLQDGSLRAVACTNALELGVDITGVDAVICCGFPGTTAALWQQVGRAGRAGEDALAVLVARPDPLDAYLCDHPELITGRLERTVLHPDNPAVLGPHLAAAAQELPLTETDERWFGSTTVDLAHRLAGAGMLRRRPAGWFWVRHERAVDGIDLRSLNGGAVDVVDSSTGRVIGQADPASADRTVHAGAIYLHQGEQWRILDYNPPAGSALARPSAELYYTQPLADFSLDILAVTASTDLPGPARSHHGEVVLRSRVTGYLRRDQQTQQVWDRTELDLPERQLRTHACWWTVDSAALASSGILPAALAGAAHAAEHAAIGLLPAFAPCDRWDIGGLSTVLHPDTGQLTVFVHDGQAGGAGFAERGWQVMTQWLGATVEALLDCPCEEGCPRCVVSPKCGNGNSPLDKRAAITLLQLVLARQE